MLVLLLTAAFPSIASAQLRLAGVFSSGMVLPADVPIPVWGSGVPGKKVSARMADKEAHALVAEDSTWHLLLPLGKASDRPVKLSVSMGEETVTCQDILLGDVWLCIGQSNMEWPVSKEMHWKAEIQNARQPLIRIMNPPPAGRNVYGTPFNDSLLDRLTIQRFYGWDGWRQCDSLTLPAMSAVAYYFAKRLVQDIHRPIGLINLSIGGAPLESFIGLDAMRGHSRFRSKTEGDWLTNDSLPVWVRERGRQNLGDSNARYSDDLGPNHAFKPGFAYASGIVPLAPFPVKGVLVYQGESNAEEWARVVEYGELFKLLVDEYRTLWKNPRLPCYWVQLSSIERVYWPMFRDVQRRLLDEVNHGGMAVTSDIGSRNDVHPRDKKTVGERLALWALQETYGRDIEASGPLPRKARYRKGKLVVAFTHAKGGLATSDGTPPSAFSIDGASDAPAYIIGRRVIIPSAPKTDFIFYGWKPYSDANLINRSGLPASTFKIPVR